MFSISFKKLNSVCQNIYGKSILLREIEVYISFRNVSGNIYGRVNLTPGIRRKAQENNCFIKWTFQSPKAARPMAKQENCIYGLGDL